jgi:transcriptional regulator with XRE-family HTH domain
VGKLLYGDARRGLGPSKRVRPATAKKILAVQPDQDLLPDRATTDGSGTRRRLRALVAAGWSQARLADRLGMLPSNFGKVINGGDPVRLGTARAVARLYDELKDLLPDQDEWHDKAAASRARRYARDRGWLPPSAWDDAALDAPEDQLQDRLARQVAAMSDDVLRRCHELSKDPSMVLDPVAAAAAAAWANSSPRRTRQPTGA